MPDERLYGVLAEFETPEALLAAAKQTRAEGYCDLDAFTPFPVEGLADILGVGGRHQVHWLGFAGACFGAALAIAMQAFTNWDYPINVGGRPLYAWSAFAVVTFELTVLFGALTPAFGMLALNGLPRLSHPVFSARAFSRASKDRFFLCVLADDRQFDARDTARFLRTLDPAAVELVQS
jgi:hypothetical protein